MIWFVKVLYVIVWFGKICNDSLTLLKNVDSIIGQNAGVIIWQKAGATSWQNASNICQPVVWVDHLDDGFIAELYNHLLEPQCHLKC